MQLKRQWLLFILCIANYTFAQTDGTIKGIVIDDAGKPVVKAKVHISETQPCYGHRLLQVYETNDQGQFIITRVRWGTYSVLAGKEDNGYADTKFGFYSNMLVPIVTLGPIFPTADVIVHLGPKAATLSIPSVTDALTGKTITSAIITLRRAENPKLFISTSSQQRILVPSLTDVSIEVTAPGYQQWPATNEAKRGRIRLRPEEVLTLNFELQAAVTHTNAESH